MRKKIIGISGRAGAGKDEVANIITRFLHPDYERAFFAAKLKDTTEFLFGWTQEQIHDREFKETIDPKWGFSPRRAMQLLGTEFGRALREDLWVHLLGVQLDSSDAPGFIITDARFDNEGDFIRDRGGILIHVIRPSGAETSESSHASEGGIAVREGDITILNDGSLEDLRDKVISVVNIP